MQATWKHSYAELGSAFGSRVNPTPFPAIYPPYWVASNPLLGERLGLPSGWSEDAFFLEALAGNSSFTGNSNVAGSSSFTGNSNVAGSSNFGAPFASVYSGHQFGVWAGQLGDGRALLLGELSGLEVQLKGAGPTPYSRFGDGRAVLRSSIREYLCSLAMQALGVPSTDALCLVGSDAPVRREVWETAAVVTRVAPSFVRFGHFEHFSYCGQHDALRTLADYVIDRFYPQCKSGLEGGGNVYAALLAVVCQRSARLVARWQAVGFCHGVLNTDNMSILGLTLDYGPFQFMEAFDPGHVCNHSDTQGRYAFDQQPEIVRWNLFCLAQALLPLIGPQDHALDALQPFGSCFDTEFHALLGAKLGDPTGHPPAITLQRSMLNLLVRHRVDYPLFWRRLSDWMRLHETNETNEMNEPKGLNGLNDGNGGQQAQDAQKAAEQRLDALFTNPAALDHWHAWRTEYLAHCVETDMQARAELQARGARMSAINPRTVLRNHIAEMAIRAATERDFSVTQVVQNALQHPFDEPPDGHLLPDEAPNWARNISISCSS